MFDQNHGLTPLQIWKFFNYSKMTFSLPKKRSFEKTISKVKTNVSFQEKWARKIFGTFDENHGLTPLEIWKVFNHNKMTFLSPKKLRFEETTSSNEKTSLFCRKWGSKDIWNFWPESWVNSFENMEFFRP